MNTRLRSIKVTLEEKIARWARLGRKYDYARAMRGALAREPFFATDGQYLSREQAHDRIRLR